MQTLTLKAAGGVDFRCLATEVREMRHSSMSVEIVDMGRASMSADTQGGREPQGAEQSQGNGGAVTAPQMKAGISFSSPAALEVIFF